MNLLKNNFVRIVIGTGILVLIPLTLQLTIGTGIDGQGFNWKPGDFVFAFVLIFGIGTLFEAVRGRAGKSTAYKIASALALIGVFLLIWVNGAVGIIGSENNDANLLYGAVIAVLFLGTIWARLAARQMERVLYAAGAVQMLVPVVALLAWRPILDEAPGIFGVFALNAVFAMLFLGSGLLFRQAAAEK